MKKIVSAILLLAICLTCFSGCDNGGNASDVTSVNTSVADASNTDASQGENSTAPTISHLTPEDVGSILNSDVASGDATQNNGNKLNIPEGDYVITPETNPANLYYFVNLVPDYLADSYCKLVAAVASCDMSCQLDITLTAEELEFLYNCIILDHPEFFHIYASEQPNHFSFSPNDNSIVYIMYEFKKANSAPDIDLIKDYNAQIKKELEAPIAEAKKYSNVFDQLTYLYYWVVDGTNISWAKYNEHPHSTIKELFLDKHGVCIGYALSLSYLYRQLGIVTTVGSGINSSNVEHTWCIPYVNGVYYAIDGYFGNEHRVNFEHSSAEYLFMTNYDKEKEMQVTPYAIYKGPDLG